MSWVYVPALAVSNSESASPCPKRVASLTWRGKAMQPQRLPRAWKTGAFTRLLSGLTLPPSTLDRGVASWIASLAAIRANPIPSPESALAPTTIGSLSTKCFASSRNAGRIVSSGKTCRGTLTHNSRLLSRHWKDWATALRQEYSARPKREHPIGASDCSSWPTARVATGAYTRDRGKKGQERLSLEGEAAHWTTPSCSDGHRGGKLTDAMSDSSLVQQVNTVWATPQARDHFPPHTPERIAAMKAEGHGMRNLNDEAAHWPTPAARDHKGANSKDHVTTNGTGRMHMDQLPNFVAHGSHSAHPDPATSDGPPSLQTRRTLNPLFVEWLMGWPTGWTDCEAAVTGFSLWQQRSRGILSTLLSPPPTSRQGRLL